MSTPADGAAPAVHSRFHIAELDHRAGAATAGLGFILTGSAICFLTMLGQTLPIPLLLAMLDEPAPNDALLAAWATFLPMIVGAAFSPVVARLSDLFGRRRVLVIALLVACAGALIGALGLGQTVETVAALIGRTLQGAGIAAIPVVLASAREMLSPQRMVTALSMFGAALGMGGVLGPPVGDVATHLFGWRSMFWGAVVVTAALALAVRTTMPGHTGIARGTFDLRGALLLTPAVLALTAAIHAAVWGERGAVTVATAVVGVLLLSLWVLTARRTRLPLLNLRSLRHPSITFAHLASVVLGWILLTNTLLMAIQVQAENAAAGRDWSPEATFLIALPSIAAMLFAAPCAAALADRFGPRALLIIGALVAAVGFVLRVYASPSADLGIVWATLVAIGASLATTALPMILDLVGGSHRIGGVNGANWMLRVCGMAIGAATVLGIATGFSLTHGGAVVPSWQSLWIVLLSSAVATALLVLFAVLMPVPQRIRRRGAAR